MAYKPIDVGVLAPLFCLRDAYKMEICLRDYRGKWIILYFYPRLITVKSKLEAIDFNGLKSEFERRNAVIIGVGLDNYKTLKDFKEKNNTDITLLSDPMGEVHDTYGIRQTKIKNEVEITVTVRTTYLLNPSRVVIKRWDEVKVKKHAEKVLEELSRIKKEEIKHLQ